MEALIIMSLRVCAVSDLHGRFPTIPTCDVLLIVGDICPDFHRQASFDPDLMRHEQMLWLQSEYIEWEKSVPADVILAVPGNHDWIVKMPDHLKTTLHVDDLVEIQGRRFYFSPWVDPCGDWNYQRKRAERKGIFSYIPRKLDVLACHSPAHDVLDKAYGDIPSGCPELRREIYDKQPKNFVFGHIHEGQRYGRIAKLGNTLCYNVAMWGDWSPVQFEV